jgi:alpha-mannosidase
MLKHPLLTESRIRQTLERIEKLVNWPTAPIEIAAWAVHGEPVPPERAFKAKYTPFSVGEMWGSLWDTVWFRFQGQIPTDWKGREVVALVRLTSLGPEGFAAEGQFTRTNASSRRKSQSSRDRDRHESKGRRAI